MRHGLSRASNPSTDWQGMALRASLREFAVDMALRREKV
ncbi:hypothetical protein D8I24_2712 (plasmid) [Cupriavidus necator H850]|nr:hypothetical protein D8I24_2712 [Cupriavidus necator H850]